MRILLDRPPVAHRKLICAGDEAKVFRLRASTPYEGMVERIQKLDVKPNARSQYFMLDAYEDMRLDPVLRYQLALELEIPSCSCRYLIYKFLALRFAKSTFPANFVDCDELRLFRAGRRWVAATYSGFIPDDTNVRKRMAANRTRFYAILGRDGWEKARQFRDVTDAAERKSNPALESLANTLSGAGITLGHFEANYHICNGATVFFEVVGINLSKALVLARFCNNPGEALNILAAIIATEVASLAHGPVQYKSVSSREAAKDLLRIGIPTQKDISDALRKELRRPWSFDAREIVNYCRGIVGVKNNTPHESAVEARGLLDEESVRAVQALLHASY